MATPYEASFIAAAKAHPELASQVLLAKGKSLPSEESQNAAILLGVRAAVAQLAMDEKLSTSALKAREALKEAGANSEQIEQLLGGLLVEEAFGTDADPNHFDVAFVTEALLELPRLAQLDEDSVGELLERFTKTASTPARPLHVACAEALFHFAWSDGPQGINIEHVDEALRNVAAADAPTAATEVMASLLRLLNEEKFIGPIRLQRLLDYVAEFGLEGAEDGPGEEDDLEAEDDES
jgi:hypothetical protein